MPEHAHQTASQARQDALARQGEPERPGEQPMAAAELGPLARVPRDGAGHLERLPPPQRQRMVLALQRAAGNAATCAFVENARGPAHDLQPRAAPAASTIRRAPPTGGQQPSLEQRVDVLEKKQAATALDLRWRAVFGARLSSYRQAIYALTAGFQTAATGFQSAHSQQNQAEQLKDQVFGAILGVAAAGLAEPFLRSSLGSLGPKLDKVVEAIENPTIQVATGGITVAVAKSGQTPASGAGAGAVADPMLFLTQNLQNVEQKNQQMENAFRARSDSMSVFTPEQWVAWDSAKQEKIYSDILKEIDSVALSDASMLEGPNTLATKIELYYWAAWIKSHDPAVKGLQVGAELAKRMKSLGLESLANVRFDTSSWIFMDHQPPHPQFEQNLFNWAAGWSQKLVK